MAKRDEMPEGMTEDELAAINEADAEETAEAEAAVTDDHKAAVAEAKPDEGKTGDKPAADADPDKKPAGAEPEKAAAAEAVADAGKEGDKPAEKPAADARPGPRAQQTAVPNWQAPADAEAKLAEINTKRDALADKFDAGDLTAKELLAEQRTLDKQEREIERALDRAQMAGEMTVAVWEKSTVPAFLDSHAHYRDNPVLLGALDAEVRRQQVAASEAGKDPLDPAILTAADAAIRKALGAIGAPVKDEEKPAADPKAEEKAAAAARAAQIPPTLGKVPASEISSTDSKYASIDRLADSDPIAFEEAVGRMSPAEREGYLARTH